MENVLRDLAPEILPATNAAMVMEVIDFLVCPECRSSSFKPYHDESTALIVLKNAVIVCNECQTCYHYDEGILEMLQERPENLTLAQRTNFWPFITANYQKYWRSWCMTLMCGNIFSNTRESGILKESLKLDELTGNDWVVDIGTSHGFYAIEVAKHLKKVGSSARVMAVDFSKKMLKQASKRATQSGVDDCILFVLADVEALPFRQNFARRVSCGGSLNEYRHPDIALQEISRILKPDGVFFAMNLFLNSMAWPILKFLALSGLTFHRLRDWNARFRSLFEIRNQFQSGIIMISTLSKS